MISSPRRIIVGITGGIVVGWILWSVIQSLWFEPVASLEEKIERAQRRIDQYDAALADAPRVESELGDYVNRTLGGSIEEVDHRLRTRLNRLGESIGLEAMSVGTSGGVVALSPGRIDFKGSSGRALREEIDFVEVEGTLSGTTTWAGVIELVDRLRQAAWINKIESIRLRGGKVRGRVEATIRLRTLFFPGRSASMALTEDWSRERLTAYAGLVERNPFVLPAPPPPAPPPAAVQPPPRRPAPPPPPVWQVTGVVGIGDAAEVWLRNVRTGQTRRLGIGQKVRGMVLEGVAGDQASFRHGESTVSIRVGEMLKDTTPVHK